MKLYFALAIVIIAAVVIWHLAKNKPKWLIYSTAGILFALCFSWFVWDTLSGYPREDNIPEHSRLVTFSIEPPENIYLVLKVDDNAPIFYRVDYTKELHEQLMKAAEAIAQNIAIHVDSVGGEFKFEIHNPQRSLKEAPE